MKSNWETTLAGVGAIAIFVGAALLALFDGDPATNPNWNVIINGIVVVLLGGGLMRAKDQNKK